MGNSLQEQLLQAGLVDKSKANKAEKERRKKVKHQRKSKDVKQTSSQSVAAAEKREHDRYINESRNEARKQREIAARIKQIVTNHKHPRNSAEDDTPFYFQNKGKIKKMFVSAETHKMITSNQLAVVNCNGEFELVPADIANKIVQLNPSLVIQKESDDSIQDDDQYADYKVPDDLIW